VRSRVGEGSAFSVTLPVIYRGATEVTYVPEIVRELDPTRLPVLVVDDNTETLFVYEQYLKGTGFQAVPVRSIKEARRALAQFKPMAVVLDILLANESSWAFLAEMKRDPATTSIPIFAITMVDNRNKALALGADDFILKPAEREWLLTKLKALAQKRESEDILIIDDDEASRYVLKGLLSGTRYQIIEAPGGQEGIRLAEERLPKVIFLDLNMPDKNGFAVLDHLKSTESTRNIPVVISTSKVLNEMEAEKLRGRTVAVLSKNHSAREHSIAQLREALTKAEALQKA
jgi:CheY-like chemotaxis protein